MGGCEQFPVGSQHMKQILSMIAVVIGQSVLATDNSLTKKESTDRSEGTGESHAVKGAVSLFQPRPHPSSD